MAIGNFNSQSGIYKWANAYHEMATGSVTSFGELELYGLSGRGEPVGRPLAKVHLLIDSHCRCAISKRGDPAWPSSFFAYFLFSVLAVSLSVFVLWRFLPFFSVLFLPFSPSHFLPSFPFPLFSKSPFLLFSLSLEPIIQTSSNQRGAIQIIMCTFI